MKTPRKRRRSVKMENQKFTISDDMRELSKGILLTLGCMSLNYGLSYLVCLRNTIS